MMINLDKYSLQNQKYILQASKCKKPIDDLIISIKGGAENRQLQEKAIAINEAYTNFLVQIGKKQEQENEDSKI